MATGRLVLLLAAVLAGAAAAADFKSVASPAAILFDAPSSKAKKLYIVNRGYPLEVTVQLEGWTKVRDANGAFSWIETKELSERRTALMRANPVQVRQTADEKAAVVFEAQSGVVLDIVGSEPGWLQVRHEDGAAGYVRANQAWGQ